MTFGSLLFRDTDVRRNIVQDYEVSVLQQFGYMTIKSNDFRQYHFSAKQRVGEMAVRENNVVEEFETK